jgi:hypothetical protein
LICFFCFFDNIVVYLYTQDPLFPEKQDFDMKRQEWLRKDGKTEKKERKVKKRRVKMKEKAKTFGALRIIYYFCRCYENRHYYSITRDAGGFLQ